MSTDTDKMINVNEFMDRYFDPECKPSRHTVWRWCRTGKLPCRRIGRYYYIKPEDARTFLALQNSA